MKRFLGLSALLIVAGLAGCSQNKPDAGPSGANYLLPAEPADALGVRGAKQQTKDGDDVVVAGRIGGRRDPWGSGQASFTIVDTALLTCSDREGDNCETPWDYCCEDPKDLVAATANVKVVDDKG